jgi:hypothetical protein
MRVLKRPESLFQKRHTLPEWVGIPAPRGT